MLAAGLGTRLRPLTERCPKPLVPVGDRPALAHVLARVAAAGLGPVTVNAHHHAGEIERFAAPLGARVSREDGALLGTAGGVRRARDAGLLSGDALVWNGDVLGDLDVGALVRAHTARGARATLLARRRPAGEGNLGADAEGRLVRLRTSSFGVEASGGAFVGVHVVGAGLSLPEQGCLVGDVYIPELARGARDIDVIYTDTPFVDVGTLEAYLEANLAWLADASGWTGARARVAAGVSLERALVGAEATVVGTGALREVVVWPGCEARAPLERAIVGPFGTVRVPPTGV